MFMHKSKKGFTIVELVIVIAVIAILAAVLIPTFSNLVKKANIAADTQLAKNLNTAMTMAEAEGKKLENFNDVLAALREGGYIVSNLNPTAEGCYFVWESASNQILLVDGEKNYEVIYKSKDLANATVGETWWFAVNSTDKKAELEALSAKVFYTPKTKEALLDAFNTLKAQTGAQSVVIAEDINLSKTGEIFEINEATAEITVDLAGTTINCAGAVDVDDYEYGDAQRAFNVIDGELTIVGGSVNAGDTYGTVRADGGTVNVKEMTLINSKENGLNLKAFAGSEIIVTDTIINAKLGGGCEAAGGTIKLTNVTVNQSGYADWCSTCVAASGGTGLVEIYSGSYNSDGGNSVIDIFSSGGTIKIYGGSFNGTDWKSITTSAAWNAMLGAAKDQCTITIAADSVTITCGAYGE